MIPIPAPGTKINKDIFLRPFATATSLAQQATKFWGVAGEHRTQVVIAVVA